MSSYIYENSNTKAFYALAWIAFTISFIGMGVGLVTLDADFAVKGFLGMSSWYDRSAMRKPVLAMVSTLMLQPGCMVWVVRSCYYNR